MFSFKKPIANDLGISEALQAQMTLMRICSVRMFDAVPRAKKIK